MLKGFVRIYEKLSSFPEIFLPISDLLHEMLQKANLPSLLQGNVRDVIDLIKTKSDEHQMLRQPLQMRKQKPVPIKLLNPKFEERYLFLGIHLLFCLSSLIENACYSFSPPPDVCLDYFIVIRRVSRCDAILETSALIWGYLPPLTHKCVGAHARTYIKYTVILALSNH